MLTLVKSNLSMVLKNLAVWITLTLIFQFIHQGEGGSNA